MAAGGVEVSRLSLADVEGYVAVCCDLHSPPRVSELARRIGVSREHLARATKGRYGTHICQLLKARQVAEAQLLLHTTALSVERVGYESGFGTPRSFYRTFRAMTGFTPAAFRGSQSVSRQTLEGADGVCRSA